MRTVIDRDGVRIVHGDVLDVLTAEASASVHCCVTSPPYWGLRDYGVDGQLGLEPTLEEYIADMVAVFQEVKRVLRDDGTLWVNMGDGYSSGDRATWRTGPSSNKGHRVLDGMRRPPIPVGLKPKDLIGTPWRLAFALQADGWYLRSDIIWHKPNQMPESVTDRPTKSHEYLFLLSKRPRYYYDAEAIREKASENTHPRGSGVNPKCVDRGKGIRQNASFSAALTSVTPYRNRRDVWAIPTQPYRQAHFATFPEKLVAPCILAGTSEEGCCRKCGAPWRRVLSDSQTTDGLYRPPQTIGWRPSCKCEAGEPIPCVVLDPFLGSGTTAVVAQKLGRRAVGVELNGDYVRMAVGRLRQRRLV